jgi:hypothetical protein
MAIVQFLQDKDNDGSGNYRYLDVARDQPLPVALYGTDGAIIWKAEDAPHASGDLGVPVLFVRRNANTSLVDTDGDYAPPQIDINGALKVTLVDSSSAASLVRNVPSVDNANLAANSGMQVGSVPYAFIGTINSRFDRVRAANVFKTVALGSGTAETTIWTPAASTRFRLMGLVLTASAITTLTFKDNTGGTTIFVVRLGIDVPITINLGNGIPSAAINNVLTVTRGTAATLDGTVWGTEEV